jgi:uncharacterized membrane protein
MLKAGFGVVMVVVAVDILRMNVVVVLEVVVVRREFRSVVEASRDARMMGRSMRMNLKVLLVCVGCAVSGVVGSTCVEGGDDGEATMRL